LNLYHCKLLPRLGLTVERPNNAASRSIDVAGKQAVVRSSVTPWRDRGKPQVCFDSQKWTNGFSVKDTFNFFVASISTAGSAPCGFMSQRALLPERNKVFAFRPVKLYNDFTEEINLAKARYIWWTT